MFGRLQQEQEPILPMVLAHVTMKTRYLQTATAAAAPAATATAPAGNARLASSDLHNLGVEGRKGIVREGREGKEHRCDLDEITCAGGALTQTQKFHTHYGAEIELN